MNTSLNQTSEAITTCESCGRPCDINCISVDCPYGLRRRVTKLLKCCDLIGTEQPDHRTNLILINLLLSSGILRRITDLFSSDLLEPLILVAEDQYKPTQLESMYTKFISSVKDRISRCNDIAIISCLNPLPPMLINILYQWEHEHNKECLPYIGSRRFQKAIADDEAIWQNWNKFLSYPENIVLLGAICDVRNTNRVI